MSIPKTLKDFIRLFFIPSVLMFSISSIPYASADGGGTYSVYDTDSDGYLDRTEYVKFYDSKRKRSKNFHFMDYLIIYSNFQGNHQY